MPGVISTVTVSPLCRCHLQCVAVSDVTRCWPVSGKFTPVQADLYDALVHTQHELLEYVRQRRPLRLNQLYFHMLDVLGNVLQKIGLFRTDLTRDQLRHVSLVCRRDHQQSMCRRPTRYARIMCHIISDSMCTMDRCREMLISRPMW